MNKYVLKISCFIFCIFLYVNNVYALKNTDDEEHAILAGIQQGIIYAKKDKNNLGKNFDNSVLWKVTGDSKKQSVTLTFNQYPYRYYYAYQSKKYDITLQGTIQYTYENNKITSFHGFIYIRGTDTIKSLFFDKNTQDYFLIGNHRYSHNEFYTTLDTFKNEIQFYDKEKECALVFIILLASINELEWGKSNPIFTIDGRFNGVYNATNWRKTLSATTKKNIVELTYKNYYLNKLESIFPFSIDLNGKINLNTKRRGDYLTSLIFDGKINVSGMRTFSAIQFDSCAMTGDVFTGNFIVENNKHTFSAITTILEHLYLQIF